MADAGFNINYDAFHFGIHKTIAYQKINHFFRTKLTGDRPRSAGRKKQTPLEERFIQITSRRVTFLTANPLCITSRNCLWYVSVHRNYPEPSPMHVENVQIIDICPLKKHFMTDTALHTNEILQYLVLDEIVIAFTAKEILLSLCQYQRGFL